MQRCALRWAKDRMAGVQFLSDVTREQQAQFYRESLGIAAE